MKKLKAFFYIFIKSISSPAYYKDLIKSDSSLTIKYYVLLVFFAALIGTTVTTLQVMPVVKETALDIKNQVMQSYPEDLVFTQKDGEWNINRDLPFVIPLPNVTDEDYNTEDAPENLVVFYKEGTIEDLDTFNTVALVNEKNLIMRDSEGIRAQTISDMPDFEFNKQTFETIIEKVEEFAYIVPIIIVVAVFSGLVFYYSTVRLVYLLIISLILWAVASFMKVKLEFGQVYRIALHAMTIPVIVGIIINAFSITGLAIPWFTPLNLVMAVLALIAIQKDGASTPKVN